MIEVEVNSKDKLIKIKGIKFRTFSDNLDSIEIDSDTFIELQQKLVNIYYD